MSKDRVPQTIPQVREHFKELADEPEIIQKVRDQLPTHFFVDDQEVIRNSEVLTQAAWKLECIRKAIAKVPEEYRQGTIDCLVYNVPYADIAHENTWRKWRKVFIRELAKNLLLI